ncbi:DUF1972 domain-containing protein [Gymnodinialimonas hymeniacidonis]|uniref:DUF1972 domain-containing protein n=1 Tax=Gymnodinialimonas hymeniacidonis TaxID=3126508 RepID=UPI0034C66BA9
MPTQQKHIAILGTVGVPACYGGFETLAEQLVRYHASAGRSERLSVACSAPAFEAHPSHFEGAELSYLPLHANGAASVPYDIASLIQAKQAGADVALMLGVSGALALPILGQGNMRIIVHVDGQEWRRQKWSPPVRRFLKLCEGLAVRHADAIIADNPAVAEDLWKRYGRRADILTYGGDQAVNVADAPLPKGLPQDYALAVCRIEPENNIEMILQACVRSRMPLICVGNWDNSRYGRELRARYVHHPDLYLLDPIYAPATLQTLRRRAYLYLHGHSAGGTNPSLVEMMHVGKPIYAFDCVFNRHTTFNEAEYFSDAKGLAQILQTSPPAAMGPRLKTLAQHHYAWSQIGAQYFDLIERVAQAPRNTQKSKISSRKDPRRFFFLPRS